MRRNSRFRVRAVFSRKPVALPSSMSRLIVVAEDRHRSAGTRIGDGRGERQERSAHPAKSVRDAHHQAVGVGLDDGDGVCVVADIAARGGGGERDGVGGVVVEPVETLGLHPEPDLEGPAGWPDPDLAEPTGRIDEPPLVALDERGADLRLADGHLQQACVLVEAVDHAALGRPVVAEFRFELTGGDGARFRPEAVGQHDIGDLLSEANDVAVAGAVAEDDDVESVLREGQHLGRPARDTARVVDSLQATVAVDQEA